MSSEKNPEVVGCNASIMKNVWEIRAREYRQKTRLEQARVEKSALPSINQDWANRVAGKLGNYKRVEKKTTTDSFEKDNNNIWKGKHTHAPAPPRGTASGLLSRPAGQNQSFISTQAPNVKDKKQHEKKRTRFLTLMTQSQPSAMVWAKSWKYNKSLPPAEGTTTSPTWGQCWMFAAQQPYAEEGKPWPNGPNTLDPLSLHLWKKADYRETDSRDIDLSLLTEDWQVSWKNADMTQKKDMSAVNGEIVTRSGLLALLVETQHHDAEWTESWQVTKPASQASESCTIPNDGLMNELVAKKQDEDRGVTSSWEDCWRLANHQGYSNSKLLQAERSRSPEWATSWKTAAVVFNNPKNSEPSLRQEDNGAYEDRSQTRETHLHKTSDQRSRDLHLQLCDGFEVLTEWNKSWQVVKNNLQPSEEMQKVLNYFEVKENENKLNLTSEKVDEQVIHTHEPSVEQSWEESWRFQQAASKTIRDKLSEGSHYYFDSQAPVRCIRPVSDWHMAWMASESHFHHDKPSLTQWMKAWVSSTWNMEHWAEHMCGEELENEAAEIQPLKESKAKILMSQTFMDTCPKKEWGASWKASSPPNLQLSLNESSAMPGTSSTTQQQRATGSEHGSKFGRSFRLANPMPHMQNHWVESSPNPYCYTALWPAGKNTIQSKINTNWGQNSSTLRLWLNSHVFVNSGHINMSKASTDPRVIMLKEIKAGKHFCSYTKKEQSDRKWAGCHLLGKTQPRPKKSSASVQKPRMEEGPADTFFEEWAESWRFFVRPGIMTKHVLNKPLLGWNASWKFLLPPHQPGNSPKVR